MNNEIDNCKTYQVYCIGENENGPCKIGKCRNTAQRLRHLQLGNARRLHVFYSIETDDAFVKEQFLHKKFYRQRMIGEWFNVSSTEIIEEIKRLDHSSFSEGDKKSTCIQIRVSKEEKDTFRKIANKMGVSLSDALRILGEAA